MDIYLQILLEFVLCCAAAYVLFFKKYLEEAAKQRAQLELISAKTYEIERIRLEFNQSLEVLKSGLQTQMAKEIEPLRAALSRDNILFQINHSELVRLRFSRFDSLYGQLYKLQQYTKTTLFTLASDSDFPKIRDTFYAHYRDADDAYWLCLVYLSDDIATSVLGLLNDCSSAFQSFSTACYTNPDREAFRLIRPSESLLGRHIAAAEKFYDIINSFPGHLLGIRAAVAKDV